jgi:hypothetical protein
VTVGDGVVSQGDENTLAAGWQRALQEAGDGQWIEICLLEGTHRPESTLTIDRDRVVIRGCGAGSVIEAPSPAQAQGPVFRVTGSDVSLDSFAITGGADVPLIESSGDRVAVRHCRLGNRTGPLLVALSGTGFHFADNLCEVGITYGVEFGGADVRVERNRFDSFGGGLATDTRGALHLAPGARFVAVFDNDLLNAGGHAITLGGLLPQIVRAPEFGPFSRLGNFVAAAVARRSPFLREVVISRNRIRSAAGSGITSRWISTEPVPPAGIDADGDGQIDLLGIAEEAATAQIPARIEGLIVSDNSIQGCVRNGAALGRRDDGAPYGGVVLGHVERATVTGNTIDGNGNRQQGVNANRPAVPVAGIFVQDGLEVAVAGNLVVDNGLDREDAARHPGAEGGIVLLETGVALEPGGVAVPGADGTVGISRRPDGPSAARVAGNRVESVRGLALQLGGSGPMQVDGNQLSRIRRVGDPMGGAVLVVNSGIAPILGGLYRVLGASGLASADQVDDVVTSEAYETGGPVRFSGNQVRFDAHQTFEAAALIIFSLDDISFQDNRLDSRPDAAGLRMLADAFLFGMTTRASGNGLSETLGSAALSLWSYGFFQSTGTSNQGTHCILIERGLVGQRVDEHNLSLCCAFPDLRILGSEGTQEFPCRPPRRNDLFLANAEFSAAFGGGA